MTMTQIQPGDLQVGNELNWAVYDSDGRLLLKRGAVISSSRQLESLLLRGIYRANGQSEPAPAAQTVEDRSTPFERLDDLVRRVPNVLFNLTQGKEHAADRIQALASELREACERWPDAMLGAVHLCHEYDYTQCHPVHSCILAHMMARKLRYEPARALSLMCAALTQNVGMIKLQEVLQRQREPLNDNQKAAVRAHPLRAKQLLEAAGVTDPVWLRAVIQHHERPDGSGYPASLRGDQICEEGTVLALADRYAAMISSRAYRDPVSAKDALKGFYLTKGQECDETLTMSFIQELGVYPPGTFVQLNTGEVGVVVKRGKIALEPVVSAYVAPRGAPYPRPFRRDCATDTFSIRTHCSPDTAIPINLSLLWSV